MRELNRKEAAAEKRNRKYVSASDFDKTMKVCMTTQQYELWHRVKYIRLLKTTVYNKIYEN